MQLTAWGRYPRITAEAARPDNESAAAKALAQGRTIPYGLGRSYGDSALAERVVMTRGLDRVLAFDPATGDLTCEAGLSLAEIIDFFLPRGFFLPVTPGTRFITVGGAIASDVHGKNHHVAGSFSDCVDWFDLMLPTGEVTRVSRQDNHELFLATCGGMGLTGLILRAAFRLKPVKSACIDETVIQARNLADIMELFEEHAEATYTVAWIDCLARGERLGRSLLMLGEHASEGGLIPAARSRLAMPVDMPGFVLNPWSVTAFNTLYYNRVRGRETRRRTHYAPFFYPLDAVHDWNRLYGRSGFTQYQFVIPKAAGYEGLKEIVEAIAASGQGSFLAVLKLFGRGNDNYLSFPMEGYTLALDFKINRALFPLLDRLDRIVVAQGGRLYLTKDVRMSAETLRSGYPRLADFLTVRERHGFKDAFASLQSRRLEL